MALRDQVEFLLNIPKIRFHQSGKFFKFCIVGVTGVFVNLGAYLLMNRLLGVNLNIAAPLAIELSIISNFFFNNIWTFRNMFRSSLKYRLLKFHSTAGAAGLVNYASFLTLLNVCRFYDVFAYLMGIAAGTLVNYSMNSYWTWRDETD